MNRFNIAGIAALFFIVLFSSQISFGQMEKHGMHKDNHHKMMIEKLNLTDTQKETVEELRFTHKREMIDLKATLEKKKLDMRELVSKGNYNRDDYLNRVKAINSAKLNIALAKANHRMDVYDLLSEEQREIFDEMKDRMKNKMRMEKMKHKKMME